MSGSPRRGCWRDDPNARSSRLGRTRDRPRDRGGGRCRDRWLREGRRSSTRPVALDREAPLGKRLLESGRGDQGAAGVDPGAATTRSRRDGPEGRLTARTAPRSRRGRRGRCRASRPVRFLCRPVSGPAVRPGTTVWFWRSTLGGPRPRPRPASARDAYRRVLVPSLTSSSSSWSNVSGFQPVASDATASSSASFEG